MALDVTGTTCDLTAAWVLTIVATPIVPPPVPPPPAPDDDWYTPEKYPLNPNGYVPIAILPTATFDPRVPVNEFNPLE